MRVFEKLTRIISREMDGLGGQEVRVPLVNPLDLWRQGGRADFVSRDMVKFIDRDGHDLVLAPSHEEAMVQLVRDSLHSYRDLPTFLYQYQTKFRDEEHTRSGLIRAKEFIMKDGYSFHRTPHELNNFFPKVFAAYERIFASCGITCLSAESGVGYMGGEKAYEFLMVSDSGDDTVIICDNCGYRANRGIAKSIKEINQEESLPVERVHTPGCVTMRKLAKQLDVRRERLAKAMLYRTSGGFVMAVVRGDYEVCKEKLANYLGRPIYGLASFSDIEALDLVPGYLSPIGRDDLNVVVDDAIARSNNLVYGANAADYHIANGNFGRDFFTEQIADIVFVKRNDRCLQCHHEMRRERAIEVGNIFKLGDFYTRKMGFDVQSERAGRIYPHMGSYGIGLGRLLSCVVEAHCDERGICWPEQLAPYKVYLMGIGKSAAVKRYVESLYSDIADNALIDDRLESPGVKFRDAELLGIPLRIVVSPQLLEKGQVEFCERHSGKQWQESAENVREVLAERWSKEIQGVR